MANVSGPGNGRDDGIAAKRPERDPAYDSANPSRFSYSECEAVVSRKATLLLTGRIVEAGESHTGPFVKFQPDDRFGFGDFRFGIDLDALEVCDADA